MDYKATHESSWKEKRKEIVGSPVSKVQYTTTEFCPSIRNCCWFTAAGLPASSLPILWGGAGVREEQNRHGPALAYAVQAEE